MATAKFLERWRSGTGRLVHLATIVLPRVDRTQFDTLRIASGDFTTAESVALSEPARALVGVLREMGPVHHPGTFGSTDLALCTAELVLDPDHAVTFPADTGVELSLTIRQTLVAHLWVGSTVTLYRYFAQDDFADAQVIFSGVITEWDLDSGGLHLSLRQGTEWNKPLTPRTVGRHEFPRAPDESVGMTLPIVYGNYSSSPMRRPWPSVMGVPYPTNHRYYRILNQSGGIGDLFSRAVLVDTGRGSGSATDPNAKVMAAGHKVWSIAEDAFATSVWMDAGAGLMAFLDTPGTIFNEDTGAGFTLPSGFNSGYVGVAPFDVNTKNFNGAAVTLPALDTRNILEPSDAHYVYFDKAAGYEDVRPMFPPVSREGVDLVDRYYFVIGYQSSPSLTGLALFGGSALEVEPGTLMLNLPVATAPTIVALSVGPDTGALMPANFPDAYEYAIRFAGGAGTAKVFFAGLVVKVRPKRVVLQSRRVIGSKWAPVAKRIRAGATFGPFVDKLELQDVTELEGNFYANLQGYADDGDGTITGTGDLLLEIAPDLLTHLLTTYGGVPLSRLERGATAFGSLVKARADLVIPNNTPQSMVHAVTVTEDLDLLSVALWLTAESMAFMTVSPYDGKFRYFVWRTDPAVDYPWKFHRRDIDQPLGPIVQQTPLTNIVTGIRVAYGYDARKRTQRSEVALGFDRSVAGYEYFGLRDQYMTSVAGHNTWLDFGSNLLHGGALTEYHAYITPGSYMPQSTLPPGSSGPADFEEGLAQHLKVQMGWAEGTVPSPGYARYQVTWGTQITTGYNDVLAFDKGGVLVQATVPAGNYATCEALAAACTDAATTALGSALFQCSYDRPTGRYYAWTSSGSPVLKIKSGSSFTTGYMQATAWASLGFVQVEGDRTIPFGVGSALAGDDQRYAETFAITNLGTSGGTKFQFDLRLKSGFYGADSASSVQHCGDLLGLKATEDKTVGYSGNDGQSYCGDSPKNNRETRMASAAVLYGPRRELVVQSRTIQDTRTALALRNRLSDLFSAPRTVVHFSTNKAPDLERGHVIEFDADLDASQVYPGPGTDGSWAGKRFVVVELTQNAGPTRLSTDVVAVDLSILPLLSSEPIPLGVQMGTILQDVVG